MWMAKLIQWSKWSVPPRDHTVPHAHQACLEGPALQICGNQINEIQCVRRCTYMHMLCSAWHMHARSPWLHTMHAWKVLSCRVHGNPINDTVAYIVGWQRPSRSKRSDFSPASCLCSFNSIYCNRVMYLCTFWNSLAIFAMCVPFPRCCYVYSLCLYLGLAHYLLHCMHMCLWAAFQKCM